MRVNEELCIGCEICQEHCPFDAIVIAAGVAFIQQNCTNCGICREHCPCQAIEVEETINQKPDLGEYRGFYVVGIEEHQEMLNKVTLELLSEARNLADKKGEKVTLLVVGNAASQGWITSAAAVGCDRILLLEGDGTRYRMDFYTVAVVEAIKREKPEVVLFPATVDGRDLAPKVACRIQTGLTADCTGLALDESGKLLQLRPTYGGSIMASIVTPHHCPQMASVRPNVMRVRKVAGKVTVEVECLTVTEAGSDRRVRFIQSEAKDNSFADLSEANIVIAGGYGLKNKENFQRLFYLCSKLNAAAAATRKAVDEGWAPLEIQVGQTGVTVVPDLYIAFGVSGALQHTLGMKNAKKIIAVNNDPAAPIFSISDVAILGDSGEILNEICERIDRGERLFW